MVSEYPSGVVIKYMCSKPWIQSPTPAVSYPVILDMALHASCLCASTSSPKTGTINSAHFIELCEN
jgi:hypothetical protein